MATGRSPVTADLGLDTAGVAVNDRGFVVVDDHLRTTAEHVWAAGDVAGSPQFTHASWHDFRVLRPTSPGGEAVTTGRLVPYTVFLTPELARVGLTETRGARPGPAGQGRQDRRRGHPARQDPARHGRGRGRRSSTPRPIRSSVPPYWGTAPGEVISAVQIAMLGGLPYHQVRDAVLTHPTMAEGLNLLFDTLDDQPRRQRPTAPLADEIPGG